MNTSAPAPNDEKFSVEVVPNDRLEDWDSFVDTSPQNNPYSKSFWLLAFSKGCPNCDFRVISLKNKSGQIVAGIAFHTFKNQLGQSRIFTSGQYNSFIFSPDVRKDSNRAISNRHEMAFRLISELQSAEMTSISLVHHPSLSDIRPWMWNGWQTIPAYTFLNRTSDRDDGFTAAQRKQIRKAEGEEYMLEKSSNFSVTADLIVSMLEKTYLRQGLNIHRIDPQLGPVKNYISILKSFCGRSDVICYSAKHPSKGIGAIRVGMAGSDGVFYDWLAGNDPDHFQFGCSSYLISEIFKDLSSCGITHFDFGGANTPKIADFKQGFNGDLICGYRTIWQSRDPLHRAVKLCGYFAHLSSLALHRFRLRK